MKKYRVIFHYEGALDVDVEANNEEEAEDKAHEVVGNMSDKEYIEKLELEIAETLVEETE